jgi:S23 ribosomal protein.
MNKEDDGFNFEKLVVYQKALVFFNDVYDVTAKFPKEEKFALIDQFHRAAISIGLNIAEGCGNSDADFKRYLKMSKGSARECVAIITLSKMRGYINPKDEDNLRNQCVELSKMLSGLIRSL